MNSFITLAIVACICATALAQFDGSYQPNNRGGLDLSGSYTKQFNDHASGSVFGQGSLNPGNSIRLQDKSYGAGVDFNRNGNSLGYKHIEAPHSRTDAVRGTVNLFDNGRSRVNANAWGSRTRPRRQIRHVDEYGGNVEWQSDRGHSASLGVNNVPQYNRQTIDATGKYNIYRDRDWTVDAFGQASKNVGQANRGRTDWSTGLTVGRRF